MWLHQQCVSHLFSFARMKSIRPYVSLYVHTHFVLPFVPADLMKSGSYGRWKTLIIGLPTVSKQVRNFFFEMSRQNRENEEKIAKFADKIKEINLPSKQIDIFASLTWSVLEWELTWSQAAAIGDPRVFLIVSSEGAAGVAKRVLFCLPELSDAFPSDILVSLSWSFATNLRQSRG